MLTSALIKRLGMSPASSLLAQYVDRLGQGCPVHVGEKHAGWDFNEDQDEVLFSGHCGMFRGMDT